METNIEQILLITFLGKMIVADTYVQQTPQTNGHRPEMVLRQAD